MSPLQFHCKMVGGCCWAVCWVVVLCRIVCLRFIIGVGELREGKQLKVRAGREWQV